MANLGTRKFYKSFQGKDEQEKNQVLKNSGYISIVLHSVFYNSKGNFWQKIFGGSDKIALTSSIVYQNGDKTIEAKAIQDKREVKAKRNHFMGLSRLVALKVPTNADGLELKVGLTAIKKDNLENAIDLMNSKEFQSPLQLSATPIGSILSVTSVVKKIFTGIAQNNHLEATFAGIVSKDKVNDPIQKERLCAGYLIMIANNDEDNDFLSTVDPTKLEVIGDGLHYKGDRVSHTNIVYSITFEQYRGIDEDSNWFHMFQDALEKLDDLLFTTKKEERKKILDDSRKLWIEASALLYNDPVYIAKEKRSIKASYFKRINERYNELTDGKENLAVVNKFIESKSDLDFMTSSRAITANRILSESKRIATSYMKELGKMNLVFSDR